MPPRRRSSKDAPAKLAKRMKRRWHVVLRAKGEILGEVEAPDVAAAKAAAVAQFELDDIQRNRIRCRSWPERPLSAARAETHPSIAAGMPPGDSSVGRQCEIWAGR